MFSIIWMAKQDFKKIRKYFSSTIYYNMFLAYFSNLWKLMDIFYYFCYSDFEKMFLRSADEMKLNFLRIILVEIIFLASLNY